MKQKPPPEQLELFTTPTVSQSTIPATEVVPAPAPVTTTTWDVLSSFVAGVK